MTLSYGASLADTPLTISCLESALKQLSEVSASQTGKMVLSDMRQKDPSSLFMKSGPSEVGLSHNSFALCWSPLLTTRLFEAGSPEAPSARRYDLWKRADTGCFGGAYERALTIGS